MNPSKRLLAFATLAGVTALAYSQVPPAATRGQLLYATHCISCHTTQMHWRTARLAHDWASLKVQVHRWQGNAGLQWVDADITEVARHLNDTIYHFPETTDRLSLSPGAAQPANRCSQANVRAFRSRPNAAATSSAASQCG